MLKNYRYDLTKPDCEIIFTFFDADGSGSISYPEFVRAILGGIPKERIPICEAAWDKLDPEGKGVAHVSREV